MRSRGAQTTHTHLSHLSYDLQARLLPTQLAVQATHSELSERSEANCQYQLWELDLFVHIALHFREVANDQPDDEERELKSGEEVHEHV